MGELINVLIEDDDGNAILPRDPGKTGNTFTVPDLPNKGDEVHVNGTKYTVLDIICRLYEDTPATITLRVQRAIS